MITGASRGIGAATALDPRRDADFEWSSTTDPAPRKPTRWCRSAAAAGGEAVAIEADVTAPDDVTRDVRAKPNRWGRVDVLVHNALIPYDVTTFADLTWEQLGGKLDRELHAAYLVTKAVVPGMISRKYGRLVFLTTGLSRQARNGMITLGTAKAALDQFVRYIALELAPHGITANLVSPPTVGGQR